MLFGILIDDIDTLADYGLILCAEVSIGSPKPRTTYVTIPEADGDLDLTGALTGGVVRYEPRMVSLELFPVYDVVDNRAKPATEAHVTLVRSSLSARTHGKKCKVWLPDDFNHYFYGRVTIGDRGGYNSGKIPVTVVADPYRYKTEITKKTVTASGTQIFTNETMRTVPTFTATDATATVTFKAVSHQLRPGDNTFEDIVLEPGINSVAFSNVNNPIVVTYQEGTF